MSSYMSSSVVSPAPSKRGLNVTNRLTQVSLQLLLVLLVLLTTLRTVQALEKSLNLGAQYETLVRQYRSYRSVRSMPRPLILDRNKDPRRTSEYGPSANSIEIDASMICSRYAIMPYLVRNITVT